MIDWSKSHNGVMLCGFNHAVELMPEIEHILESIIPHLQHSVSFYVVDVKVHMLMPEQYPCIPNWHCDFVPRDKNLVQDRSKITGDEMYVWISGAPFTEYKSFQRKIQTEQGEWTVINQRDFHRGVKSEIHTWRCFIRIIPLMFIHPTTINQGTLRRHTQVYIDQPEKFKW